MTDNPPIVSGVSWVHDTLRDRLQERSDNLKNMIAMGVPESEYRQMVGRFRENKRMLEQELPELFTDFYAADDSGSGEELEDLPE